MSLRAQYTLKISIMDLLLGVIEMVWYAFAMSITDTHTPPRRNQLTPVQYAHAHAVDLITGV